MNSQSSEIGQEEEEIQQSQSFMPDESEGPLENFYRNDYSSQRNVAFAGGEFTFQANFGYNQENSESE